MKTELKGPFINEDKVAKDIIAMIDYSYKEKDPNGLSSSDPGAKLDDGKPDLDLVLGDFNRALIEVGRVGTFGAKKYSRSGWLKVPNGLSRYASALWRHFLSKYRGETLDKDSGLSHSAHLAWNALAVLELELREKENDDQRL